MAAAMTSTSTITPPATGGLTFGSVRSSLPVVLAPMAGITNAAYRQVCREQAEAGVAEVVGDTASRALQQDPTRRSDGLFVCEMVTSRGIVERDPKSLAMLSFDPGERTRSVQLYGVDPATMAEATRIICGEFGVAHVDLNFGCPVPKVTRRGGGAVLPYKRNLLGAILRAVVDAASPFGRGRHRRRRRDGRDRAARAHRRAALLRDRRLGGDRHPRRGRGHSRSG